MSDTPPETMDDQKARRQLELRGGLLALLLPLVDDLVDGYGIVGRCPLLASSDKELESFYDQAVRAVDTTEDYLTVVKDPDKPRKGDELGNAVVNLRGTVVAAVRTLIRVFADAGYTFDAQTVASVFGTDVPPAESPADRARHRHEADLVDLLSSLDQERERLGIAWMGVGFTDDPSMRVTVEYSMCGSPEIDGEEYWRGRDVMSTLRHAIARLRQSDPDDFDA